MADEKFDVVQVTVKMRTIDDLFAAFADTLDKINAFVESNVNASLASSAYGDLGAKLLNIWNYNSATFGDFHENFDNWSKVVAIITANNSKFAVDAQATYRDNVGTLDGVKEARDFISKSNGLANVSTTEGFNSLSSDARSVLDSAYRAITEKTKKNNTYGGKTITYTDADGKKVSIYYDEEGILVGKKVGDQYYNDKGVKVDGLPSASKHAEEKQEKIDKAKEEDEKRKSGILDYEIGKVPAEGVEAANIARLDSGTGGRATLLDFQVDGVSLGQDGTITIKKGTTVKIKVQFPEEIEGVQTCKRTNYDGGGGWSKYVSQQNDPMVKKNDSSTYVDTREYDWYITGKETGTITLSQTALFSLTGKHKYGTYKGMCRLRVKIVD